ncbi:MAG: OsmC family protein [Actinomycetes bacterium]
MSEPRPKVFEYEIELATDGQVSIPDGTTLALPGDWTADHLLLVALVRCSIDSLRYHARRAGLTVAASGAASGRVTKRDEDGRYGFVGIEVGIEVRFEPATAEPQTLFAKAERDCFVGASLRVKPQYEWRLP